MKDNILAFPGESQFGNKYSSWAGMTLRDYLAAKAMQALMDWPNEGDDDVAKRAYEMADAMIRARDA